MRTSKQVATQLADVVLRYDETVDRIWSVSRHGVIEAAVAIDGADGHAKGAHLRWIIASDRVRGKGLGDSLVRAAVDFCRERAYPSVYLWTFEGLEAARHLYEKVGFVVTEALAGETRDRPVIERRYELTS